MSRFMMKPVHTVFFLSVGICAVRTVLLTLPLEGLRPLREGYKDVFFVSSTRYRMSFGGVA